MVVGAGSCQIDDKGAAERGNQKNRSREGTTFTDNFLSAKMSVKIQRSRGQDPGKGGYRGYRRYVRKPAAGKLRPLKKTKKGGGYLEDYPCKWSRYGVL